MIRLTSILGAALFVVGALPMSSPAQESMPDSAEIVPRYPGA